MTLSTKSQVLQCHKMRTESQIMQRKFGEVWA